MAGAWLPAIKRLSLLVYASKMATTAAYSFVALNDESASVDASFDFTPVWNSMPAGGQLLCGGAVFTRYCRRDAFAHQPEKRQAERALDGAAGLCWYEDSKLQTPGYLSVNLMAPAEQAQLPSKLFTQNIGAHESKAPEGVLPVSQTQQGEAQIWRREVSSRYGQYPKAQAAQPDQLMSDYFSVCRWRCKNKNAAFSLPR